MYQSINHRPGVTSGYTFSSGSYGQGGFGYAAVVAPSASQSGIVYTLESAEQAENLLPDSAADPLLLCTRLLLEAGVPKVFAVAAGEDLPAALALLESCPHIGALVCAAPTLPKQQLVQQWTEARCQQQQELVAFVGAGSQPAQEAKSLNSQRVVLCAPGGSPDEDTAPDTLYCACAMAALVLTAQDPAQSFSGAVLPGLAQLKNLPEAQVQQLLGAGVTVLEKIGEEVQCVRALTTQTMQNGRTNRSLSPLSTILCVDYTLQAVRSTLKARLQGGSLSARMLGSLSSQAMVELAALKEQGVLSSFEPPKAFCQPEDPALCVVELTFTPALAVNRIHIAAHIRL